MKKVMISILLGSIIGYIIGGLLQNPSLTPETRYQNALEVILDQQKTWKPQYHVRIPANHRPGAWVSLLPARTTKVMVYVSMAVKDQVYSLFEVKDRVENTQLMTSAQPISGYFRGGYRENFPYPIIKQAEEQIWMRFKLQIPYSIAGEYQKAKSQFHETLTDAQYHLSSENTHLDTMYRELLQQTGIPLRSLEKDTKQQFKVVHSLLSINETETSLCFLRWIHIEGAEKLFDLKSTDQKDHFYQWISTENIHLKTSAIETTHGIFLLTPDSVAFVKEILQKIS